MASNILADRDANAMRMSASPEKRTEKPKAEPTSMEYHRQMLESRLKEKDTTQTYISPSDDIMSPATQKLNAFRNKNIMKRSKPQTLFAKTSSKNFEAAKSGGMFADIPTKMSHEKKKAGEP